MLKKSLSVMLVLLLIGVLAINVIGAEESEKVKITYWAWAEHIDVAKELEDKFEDQNPNIDIEPVKMGPWDLHDKVLISLMSGSGAPDVALIIESRVKPYIDSGATGVNPRISNTFYRHLLYT